LLLSVHIQMTSLTGVGGAGAVAQYAGLFLLPAVCARPSSLALKILSAANGVIGFKNKKKWRRISKSGNWLPLLIEK
jgi:uncharacterized membrane protein YfcA